MCGCAIGLAGPQQPRQNELCKLAQIKTPGWQAFLPSSRAAAEADKELPAEHTAIFAREGSRRDRRPGKQTSTTLDAVALTLNACSSPTQATVRFLHRLTRISLHLPCLGSASAFTPVRLYSVSLSKRGSVPRRSRASDPSALRLHVAELA